MSHFFRSAAVFFLLSMLSVPTAADEGMFPLSGLEGLDLSGAGLQVGPQEIFNPEGLSLVDGICKINGCTGSFVSPQGLILTNHHCAYRAIQEASTSEQDFLAAGFAAASLAEEVPALGYTVRITASYQDVSDAVLSAVQAGMDPLERTKALTRRRNELSLQAEQENPGMRGEVAEMFPGVTYMLFLYTYLQDVRLVMAPPLAVGNFGGELDNWAWPRHTGDFSFLRAYVGPDGQPAAYDPGNVPYRPRRVLQVNQEGVSEGDPVFIVGYPGRTYRHRSGAFLEHELHFRLPAVVDWNGWLVETFEALGKDDRDRQLKLASRLRGYHNRLKNYRGKLQGLERLQLLEVKRADERRLQEFILEDPQRAKENGQLLARFEKIYAARSLTTEYDLWLYNFLHNAYAMRTALVVWENAQERDKPEAEREAAYMSRNLHQTRQRLELMVQGFVPEADARILVELLRRGGSVSQVADLDTLAEIIGTDQGEAAAAWLAAAFQTSVLMDREFLVRAMAMDSGQLRACGDPFLDLAAALYPAHVAVREESRRRKGELDQLQASLLAVKRSYQGQDFVPDANGTLRLTYGRIKGYAPRDAIWSSPLTTAAGILEKETLQGPYQVPQRLKQMITARDFGPFASPEIGGMPVNMLYSTDTVGGTSGSPVFNAAGKVVGLNFDRPWEATINDYTWSPRFSRSIGVDVRYILWLTWKLGACDRILEEMNVSVSP